DRRVADGGQGWRVSEHTGDRRSAGLGQSILRRRVVEQRLTGVIPCGEVDVKAGPAFVIERLGHEGGQLVLLTSKFLDGALEAERAIGGVEGFGVPKVDLELPAGEFVIRSDDLEPVGGQVAKHTQQHILRIALQSGYVDVAGRL